MTEHQLSLAVNGRERLLAERLVPVPRPSGTDADGALSSEESVVVMGLGYVGLPTAYTLRSSGARIIGLDVSENRLRAIKTGEVDLPPDDRRGLASMLASGGLELTNDASVLARADAVIVCVPTPVDEQRIPDLTALSEACATLAEHAIRGQTIVLTSTTFVGTTRQLLVEPLEQRGAVVGTDIFVAFSPERIDPGNLDHVQRETPRIVGGVTGSCAERAGRVIGALTDSVYLVSSPEAAELTKLYENIFRAVNLALANEVADVCGVLGLDPIEVTIAAGTKPYGFLGSFPGPGVGGHCIPCDPHYLLWQLRQTGHGAPMIEQAMRAIAERPRRVVRRVLEVLAEEGLDASGSRVLLAGVSYKAGVRDLRDSPALPVLSGLAEFGVEVGFHDPLVPSVELDDGRMLHSEANPDVDSWDLVVVHTVHPDFDYGWIEQFPLVLDATYQYDEAAHRQVV
ncbi:nucleotide sugar dehydrogenase [Parasphingorhabdus pacifica]